MRDERGRLRTAVVSFLGVVTGLLVTTAPLHGQAPAPKPAPPAAEATVSCFECHTDYASPSIPHARAARAKAGRGVEVAPDAYCSTCHGDGKAHIEAGGDKALIGSGKAAAATCVTCHKASGPEHSFTNGVHTQTGLVDCLSCHSIHKSDARQKSLLVKEPTALCESCHTEASASFRSQTYKHNLGRGDVTCVSCHQPHGRSGKDSLRKTRSGELPCLSCHPSQRGPHVFDHVSGSTGDCSTCHRPHGSPNPHQLTRPTEAALCLDCHSPTGGTLGSQPPSSHDLLTARWRSCTVCHTAVHGSNRSPKLLK